MQCLLDSLPVESDHPTVGSLMRSLSLYHHII